MNTFAIALLSICLSVAAQFALKGGMQSPEMKAAMLRPISLEMLSAIATNLHLLTGFALYGIGAVVWLLVLAKWDVSKAYPLVGIGFVLTLVIGALSGESVGGLRLIGVSLVCLGVVLIGRS